MKHKFTLLLLLSLGLFATAQQPGSMRLLGSNQDDLAYSVCAGNAGSYYVTGYFSGTVTTSVGTLTSAGLHDIYIVKYDAAGSVVWARSAGSSSNDAGYSVSSRDGYVYVTGIIGGTSLFGTNTLSSNGSDDGFMAKYDDNGNCIWVKKAGGSTGMDRADEITFENGNTMYMCASIVNGKYDNNTTFSTSGGVDVYIIKMDTAGTVKAYRRIGGTSNDYAFSLKYVNGSLYVAGTFASTTLNFGTTAKSNASTSGKYDAFAAKYDTALVEVWGNTGGGSGNDDCQKIIVDNSGNVYASGSFVNVAAFDTIVLNSEMAGSADGMCIKYNVDGDVIWAKRLGAFANGSAREMLFDAAGNIMIWGIFQTALDTIGGSIASNGMMDFCKVKYSPSTGNIIERTTYGGTGDDVATDAVVIGNKEVLVGSLTTSMVFNGVTYNSNGGMDIAVWEFANPNTGIKDIENNASFEVYPNPSVGSIHVKATQKIKTIDVYDLTGRCVESFEFGSSMSEQIIQTNLKAGMYILCVNKADGEYLPRKIQVQ